MQIKRTVVETVPVGKYLVTFEAIWGTPCNEGKHDDCMDHGCMDNEPSYVAEIEPSVNLITEDNYMGLDSDVRSQDESLNAEALWQGDTHDLRPRIFDTEVEAKEHAEFTLNRFNNRQVWESFVTFK